MHHSCFLSSFAWGRAGLVTVENWLWQFSLSWHSDISVKCYATAYMETNASYKSEQAHQSCMPLDTSVFSVIPFFSHTDFFLIQLKKISRSMSCSHLKHWSWSIQSQAAGNKIMLVVLSNSVLVMLGKKTKLLWTFPHHTEKNTDILSIL